MNLGSLRERVRNLSGIQVVELASDSRVEELINEAYLELCSLHQWPFLYVSEDEPVDAGEGEVDLPYPIRKLTSVVWADGDRQRRLGQVTFEELERLELDAGTPGSYAMVTEDRLLLAPEPETAGTVLLRGLRKPARLQSDSDSPLFDAEFHTGIAYAAASRLLAEEGDDSGRAQAYIAEAGGVLERMHSRYMRAHDTAVFQMGSRRSRKRRTWRLG